MRLLEADVEQLLVARDVEFDPRAPMLRSLKVKGVQLWLLQISSGWPVRGGGGGGLVWRGGSELKPHQL